VTDSNPKSRKVKTPGLQIVEYQNYHRYKIDGEWVVGVTTALNGIPKNLTRWAARTVADYAIRNLRTVSQVSESAGYGPAMDMLTSLPDARRDEAAIRGTEVHALAEKYIQGEAIDVSDDLFPYVEGYAEFISDYEPESLHEELVVGNRTHGFAGRLDSIQRSSRFGTALIDYKTSNRLYGNHALQCVAYCGADIALIDGATVPFEPLDTAFILHIQPRTYDLIPVTVNEWAFESFLVCLDHYKRNVQSDGRKLKELMGEPLPRPQKEPAA
jgi:hypothetical protein